MPWSTWQRHGQKSRSPIDRFLELRVEKGDEREGGREEKKSVSDDYAYLNMATRKL